MTILLQDGDLLLRELEETDLPLLVRYANNKKVSINLRDAFPNPYTFQDARNFLNLVKRQENGMIFAIEYQGVYTGNTGLVPGTDVYRKSAEIGYFIGEPFWNKGITTKAVTLLTEFGFRDMDFVRIHAGVFAYNKASQRVLEKCGYHLEGVFRNAVIKNGVMCDEMRYAKIKE